MRITARLFERERDDDWVGVSQGGRREGRKLGVDDDDDGDGDGDSAAAAGVVVPWEKEERGGQRTTTVQESTVLQGN